jgi:uncharacterized membrane protein (UPF0136 family)
MTLMDILKKVVLGVLSPLFIILLLATAFDIGFIRSATNKAQIKNTVSETGIYGSVVPAVLDKAGSISTYRAGEIPLKDPGVQAAAQKAFPPSFVKSSSESFIDSIYRWLDGKTREPDFYLDINPQKAVFASNVAEYVQQRLNSLPACAPNVLPSPATLEVFSLSCKPRLLDTDAVAATVRSEVANNFQVIDHPYLTANQIGSNSSGKSIFQDQLKDVPKQYQRAKKTPFVLTVLTILTGVGIVFLSSTWQKGLRHIGINLAVIGVLMLVFSYGLNRVVSTKVVPKITVDNVILQKNIRSLATDITQQIDKNYWFFGGLYTLLGAGSITAAEIYGRRAQPAPEHLNKGAPETGDTDGTPPKKKP